ncbi:class I SAM-dependent methyltransferase [Akkermansiaceae bacterium]|nr:class I SAM-dependent methyltransferase [Akkermansiaceae bacterium]
MGLYSGGFKSQLKGKKILELGCGDCTNVAIMAALGAEVYGNDISQVSGEIISEINSRHKFDHHIQFVAGDFLSAVLEDNFFDIILGKAFVHHLTHEQELEFTKRISKYLKPSGLVRYFEPAVNSRLLDTIRWMIPVPGRPSKFQASKFAVWKENDPHPERDNSSDHYRDIGEKYFNEITIQPLGSLERFCRFIPFGLKRPLRRIAFKLEKCLPHSLNMFLARSQVVEYRFPRTTNER